MIPLLIVAVIGTGAFVLLTRSLWAARRPTKSTMIVGLALTLLATLVILTASGRMHWIGALGAMIVPFLRVLMTVLRIAPTAAKLASVFQKMKSGAGPTGPSRRAPDAPTQSEVSTADLEMVLDHETGEMSGRVLRGDHAGRSLSELDDATLATFYGAIEDPESLQLLDAYICLLYTSPSPRDPE